MAGVDGLLRAYERFARLPWDPGLAGPQKVWFALYNPLAERRLRCRLSAFALATTGAGHGWRELDLAKLFPRWMGGHQYRDRYFRRPDALKTALDAFAIYVTNTVRSELQAPGVNQDTVIAISGLASLFGLMRFSGILKELESQIQGRLLVFFPGQRDGPNYRLLDARDGWNYHAIPITGEEGIFSC